MHFLINILKIKQIPNLSWSSNDPFNFKPKLKTFIYLVFGLILFGLGETLLITANQGVSPWTVLAQGCACVQEAASCWQPDESRWRRAKRCDTPPRTNALAPR